MTIRLLSIQRYRVLSRGGIILDGRRMSGLPSGIIFVHGMENNPKSAVEEFAQVMDNDYEPSGVVLGVSYAENAESYRHILSALPRRTKRKLVQH